MLSSSPGCACKMTDSACKLGWGWVWAGGTGGESRGWGRLPSAGSAIPEIEGWPVARVGAGLRHSAGILVKGELCGGG